MRIKVKPLFPAQSALETGAKEKLKVALKARPDWFGDSTKLIGDGEKAHPWVPYASRSRPRLGHGVNPAPATNWKGLEPPKPLQLMLVLV